MRGGSDDGKQFEAVPQVAPLVVHGQIDKKSRGHDPLEHVKPLAGQFLSSHVSQGVPAVTLVVELGLYDVNDGGFRDEGGCAPAVLVAWQLVTFLVDVCTI